MNEAVRMFPSTEISSQIWCAGLPLVDQKPLPLVLKARLERRAMVLMWLTLSVWVTAPLTFLGTLAVFASIDGQSPWMAVMVALLGAVVFQICKFRDWTSERLDCLADSREGCILRFEGNLRSLNRLDPTQKQLLPYFVRAGGAATLTDDSVVFATEVLSRSSRVLTANCEFILSERIKVDIVEISELPANAVIAAQWLQPLAKTADSRDVSTGRRELSSSEIAELSKFNRRLQRETLCWTLVSFVTCCYCTIITALSHDGKPSVLTRIFLGGYALLMVPFLLFGISQFRLVARLRRDLQAGQVKIVEIAAARPRATPDVAASSSGLPGPLLFELLPLSLVIWNVNGESANWRRLGRSHPEILERRKSETKYAKKS